MDSIRPRLSSEDCEFLATLRSAGGVPRLCETLGMDKAQASRRLAKIHARAPVLDKVEGRWALTRAGEAVIDAFGRGVLEQARLLGGDDELRIGAMPAISERLLAPGLPEFLARGHYRTVRVLTDLDDPEAALLRHHVDAIVARRPPRDPLVRYRKLLHSPYALAYPGVWPAARSERPFLETPHVAHESLNVREILRVEDPLPPPVATFDHLNSVREAVRAGLGWSIFPRYLIAREIDAGELREYAGEWGRAGREAGEHFHLWWLASRWRPEALREWIAGMRAAV